MITDEERDRIGQALSSSRTKFHVVPGGMFDLVITEIIGRHVEGQLEEITRQRDVLAQAIWNARRELGFDCNGDEGPEASIAGMGFDWFADQHVREAQEIRKDYDSALDEIPD